MAAVGLGSTYAHLVQSGILKVSEEPGRFGVDRRSEERAPFIYKLQLTPVETGDNLPDDLPIEVFGNTISANGFCFTHIEPLPFRHVRISAMDQRLDELGLRGLSFELVVKWCRFFGKERYQSGGKIIWPQAREEV